MGAVGAVGGKERERGNMQMEQEGHESGGKRNKAGTNVTLQVRHLEVYSPLVARSCINK